MIKIQIEGRTPYEVAANLQEMVNALREPMGADATPQLDPYPDGAPVPTTPLPSPAPTAGYVPTPQPPAAVSVPSVPEPGTHLPGVVDSRGIPWDARIHAESKAIKQDGQWRNKRGVDKVLLSQVEAQLLGGAVPPAPTFAASVPIGPPAIPQPPVTAPPGAPAPAPLPVTGPPPLSPQPPVEDPVLTAIQLGDRLLSGAGLHGQEAMEGAGADLIEVCARHRMANLADLKHPDHCDMVHSVIAQLRDLCAKWQVAL